MYRILILLSILFTSCKFEDKFDGTEKTYFYKKENILNSKYKKCINLERLKFLKYGETITVICPPNCYNACNCIINSKYKNLNKYTNLFFGNKIRQIK